MSKYVDADKLIAEIERRNVILDKYKDSFETAASCKQELEWMKGLIGSLQQEQTNLDFIKEVDMWVKDNGDTNGFFYVQDLAKHFYELGLKARKG